jgi:hypothetical protein
MIISVKFERYSTHYAFCQVFNKMRKQYIALSEHVNPPNIIMTHFLYIL